MDCGSESEIIEQPASTVVIYYCVMIIISHIVSIYPYAEQDDKIVIFRGGHASNTKCDACFTLCYYIKHIL